MDVGFITFRSVTTAQRGEKLLKSSGVACALRRTPRWMEEQGCGYCLELRDLERGTQLLRGENIPFRKRYRRDSEGQLREVGQ